MKRLVTAFALTALAAGSLALAQQSSPQTSSAPPASSSAQSSSTMSAADKQALMKKCVTQVQAANPTASMKDIQAYCDRQVQAYSSESTESTPKN
jgi:Ni/Co efflux regulator RcnB